VCLSHTPTYCSPSPCGRGWREATGEGQPRFSAPQISKSPASPPFSSFFKGGLQGGRRSVDASTPLSLVPPWKRRDALNGSRIQFFTASLSLGGEDRPLCHEQVIYWNLGSADILNLHPTCISVSNP